MLTDREWAPVVRDGIVPTPMGEAQKEWWMPRRPKYAGKADESKSIMAAQAQLMQGMNIIYPPGLSGRTGFFQVFKSLETAGNTSLSVEYLQPLQPCLMPGPRLLSCGAKLDRIVNFILNARGTVMVYSEFVWAGVVPLAIALEHAGFSRYGENNMLQQQTKRATAAAGNYAILSGTSEVMGRKSFTEILETVNNPNNKTGSKVKVVLLTQVASEGLTLKNVREVHIVEPWYHFNQLEQVIGRAVRTCSHEALPLEERNVTVYLHCATADGIPTPDEHAYEIAARKLGQIELVEKALRDNAIDCALNVNINYVPPTAFGFRIQLNTSQGARVNWKFGDAAASKPKCARPAAAAPDAGNDAAAINTRHLQAIMPTAMARLSSHLALYPRGTRVPVDELIAASKLPHAVAMSALIKLVDTIDTDIVTRLDGDDVIVQKIVKREKGKLIEIGEAAAAAAPSTAPQPAHAAAHAAQAGYSQLLMMLPANDADAKFTLYSMFTRASFMQFGADVVSGKVPPTERAASLFDTEGVWVKSATNNHQITGFVNIYTPRSAFEVFMGTHKASNAQTETLKAKRVYRDIPDSAKEQKDTVGFFGLKRDRAAAGDVVQLSFQLLMPNSLPGNQRGAFCETKGKDELKTLITTLNPGFFAAAGPSKHHEYRKTLCTILASELQKKPRQMMFPPYYK